MADVNANINVNVDTSSALSQIKALQRQLSEFYTSISRSSASAAMAQRDLQSNLVNTINSLGGFSAEMRTVKTSAESFTSSLEKNKFSMREYFRYAGASTKTFGSLFKSEFDTINKVAEENVKRLQTQYIKLGRDSTGAMKAIAVMPTSLNLDDVSVKTQMAAQKQALFNQLVKQGSTNLLNFGKNTQWAGRQLMVGFTIPLTILGNTAAKSFMDMETAALKFRKVYGDLFTPAEETQAALDTVKALGESFTRYGIAVSSTVGLAAEAAAAGFQGLDLQRQVTEATRLQVLGQVDQQKALETTISLQNAFQMSSEELSGAINFLNAVENQTVVSLDDITTAIPKAAPVVRQLGGDVKDLAFFMAAMKEGGINASEGANALKSGLASLINPTGKAKEMMMGFGIDIDKIVNKNAGNVKQTVIEFAQALDGLSDLNRQRAIEQLFGKFQLARLSTLFENVTKSGNQASRVLDLATASTEDLAAMAEKELGMTADSAMNKFRKSVEDLKLALVPVGQVFLETVTPILEFLGNALDKFNGLSSGAKRAITVLTVTIGAIGPIALMTFGLLANALANGIKFVSILRTGYLKLTGQSQILGQQTDFLTVQQQEAAAVAHSLDQSHARLTQTFNAEKTAVSQLASAYTNAARAASSLIMNNPGMVLPGRTPKKFAEGGIISGPGTGTSDSIPAMVSNGESIIPAKQTKKYRSLIQGMIADNIPGFKTGVLDLGNGRRASIDVSTSGGLPGMQAMITSILNAGNGVANATEIVDEVISRFAGKTKVTTGRFIAELDMVTKAINGERLEKKVFTGAGRARSYKGTTEIADQIRGNETLEAEYERAAASGKAAQEAGKRYFAQQGEIVEDSDQRLIQGGQVQRAHIVTLQDQTDKLFSEAWDPDMWVAQAAPLNQMSNIISDNYVTQANQQVYLERLLQLKQEGLIDENDRLTIERKITAGVALTDRELTIQKEVLKRMLANASDMARVIPAFGAQASMAIGATEYLEKNPAPMGAGTRLISNTQAAQARLAEAKYGTNPTADRSQLVLMTPAARAAAESRLRAEGQVLSTSAVTGAVAGAATASPSKKTIPIGEDIARGLEVGMQSRMDDVTRSGQNLSNAAVAGTRSGSRRASSPGGTVGPGGIIIPPMPPVGGGGAGGGYDGPEGPMFGPRKPTRFDKTFGSAAGRFRNVSAKFGSGKYAGVGFAASMGVSAASMMPGPVGNVAQKAMPAIFGLQALQMALKLPIPHLKAVAGVALLAYGAFKLFNSAREKERLAIEGLGDAATLSAEKVKTLGEFFGVAPTQTKLERTGPSLILNQEKRSQVDQLRGTESFQKDFGKDIKSLKGASDAQAKLIFNSLAIQLKGKGFAKENIDTIVKALQEESGKTNIKFDFANIDLATERGRATLQRTATNLGNNFGKQFSEGYSAETKTGVNRATGEVITWTEEKVSKGLKKSVATTSKAIAGMFNGLSGQIENGSITAEQFNQSFEGISKTIEAMPEPQGMFLLDNILKNMPGDLAKTAVGIKNMSDKFLIAQAAMLGVATITPAMVKQLKAAADSSDSGAARAANRVRAKIKSDMKAVQEMFDIVKKEMDDIEGGGSVGGGEESPFTRLKKQLKESIANAQNAVVSFNKMRASGIGIAQALELSQDPLIAMVLATTKSKAEFNTIIKLIKTMNKELDSKALGDFLKGLQGNSKLKSDFLNIIPTLEKMGLTSEEIMSILDKPDVARGMIKGLNDAKDKAAFLKQYIDGIIKDRVMNVRINVSTTEGMGQALSSFASEGMKILDAQAAVIRRAAKTGTTSLIDPNLVKLSADQSARLAKINLDASQKAIDAAKANVSTQQKVLDGLNDEINGKQRLIDINQGLIDGQQLLIDKIDESIKVQEDLLKTKEKYVELTYDEPLKALSEENSLLSNYQSQIQNQQKAINEAYDKQQQSMEEMNRLNQQSIEQGKQKISIADALSQGDISAAAQAVQDLRAQEAAANAAGMQSMFGAARQGALNNVTAGGMNSAQIEERQYQISQQSFKLEQDKAAYIKLNILPIQKEIARLEETKIPMQNEINRITKINEGIQRDIENIQRTQVYNAERAVETAEKAVTEAEAKLAADEKIVDEIIDQLLYAGLTKEELIAMEEKAALALATLNDMTASLEAGKAAAAAIANIVSGLNGKTATIFINYVTTGSPDGSPSPTKSKGGGADAAYDEKIGFDRSTTYTSIGAFDRKTFGGPIRKYAMGGSVVPGEGLLDSVKALLTPGEFVVNKASAQAYAPLLEAINGQTYPMMNVSRGMKNNRSTKNTPMQFDMPNFSSMPAGSQKAMVSNINVSQNQTSADNSSAVYNYDVNININGNNMDTESVANTVLVKIKQLQDQQIRRRLK
jgi:TP901 family phage tail tape measure protein